MSISLQSAAAGSPLLPLAICPEKETQWVCARLSGLFVFQLILNTCLHISYRTGLDHDWGVGGSRTGLWRVTWRCCSSSSKSKKVPESVFFFSFLLSFQELKRKCCNHMLRSWVKHGSDATLSNIKQRDARSRHSKVQLEVIFKRGTSPDWKLNSHTWSCATPSSTSP